MFPKQFYNEYSASVGNLTVLIRGRARGLPIPATGMRGKIRFEYIPREKCESVENKILFN